MLEYWDLVLNKENQNNNKKWIYFRVSQIVADGISNVKCRRRYFCINPESTRLIQTAKSCK